MKQAKTTKMAPAKKAAKKTAKKTTKKTTSKKAAAKKPASQKAATSLAPASAVKGTVSGGRVTKQPQVKQTAAVAHAMFLHADDGWSLRYFDQNDLHFLEREVFG